MSTGQKSLLDKFLWGVITAGVSLAVSWGASQQQLKAQDKTLERHEDRIGAIETASAKQCAYIEGMQKDISEMKSDIKSLLRKK